MDEQEIKINRVLKDFAEKLPKFPDGRIDYSHSNEAPVLNCFVKFRDKILLLKRSDKVRVYQRKWNAVTGYLDKQEPIRNKVLEELREETGILQKDILQIRIGSPYEFFDFDVQKTGLSTRSLLN